MGRRFPCKETNWDFLPLGNSFFNFLFRPSEPPSRLFTSDVHFDLRFEQFVLSAPRVTHTPNLWLQTNMPRVDYISDLSVFQYKGWRACPHKGVKMICRVMDGEDPKLLTSRRENTRTGRDLQLSSAYAGSTESASNTDRVDSMPDLGDRSGGVTSSTGAERCSSSSEDYNHENVGESNVLLTGNSNSLNETTGIISSSSRIPNQAGTSLRRRTSANATPSHTSCDNSISHCIISSSIACRSYSSSESEPNVPRALKRKHTDSTPEKHNRISRDNTCGTSSSENSIRNRNQNINSRSNDYIDDLPQASTSVDESHGSLATKEDRKVSSTEDIEDCDYLECRLIRSKDCAICLEPYVEGTILLALPCAHHYHRCCILPWLQRVPQCPSCRWPAYDQKYDFSY